MRPRASLNSLGKGRLFPTLAHYDTTFLLSASLLTGGALFGATLVSTKAEACCYAILQIETTYPGYYASDVPANAVLFAYGQELDAAAISLVDSAGQLVATEVRAVEPSGFDIVPSEPLKPNQQYELRAEAESEQQSVPFTTGSGSAEPVVSLFAPNLDPYAANCDLGTWGEQTAMCLGVDAPAHTQLEMRLGGEVIVADADPTLPILRAYGQALADTDCFEVRFRHAVGQRSAATTLCGSDLDHSSVEPGEGGYKVNGVVAGRSRTDSNLRSSPAGDTRTTALGAQDSGRLCLCATLE